MVALSDIFVSVKKITKRELVRNPALAPTFALGSLSN